ncbi:MAG: FHA domain-containing protein [Monoglobales bacterium]|uniref:FHA domain-containing protein n=1 Tax=Candidatus Ventrimonas sp. TaxID=3048889 RepID=UPI003A14C105
MNTIFILIIIAAVLCLAGGIGLAVYLIRKRNRNKAIPPFELIDEKEEPQEEKKAVQKVNPEAQRGWEGHYTRRLFDSPLKSYVLELQDLKVPGNKYRVNVSNSIKIGRKHECDICIENATLSGHHCEIYLRNGKMYIRDLNSTNGTYLNGNLNSGTEEELTSGSILSLGAVKLKVELKLISI